jgi:hypothetical protein
MLRVPTHLDKDIAIVDKARSAGRSWTESRGRSDMLSGSCGSRSIRTVRTRLTVLDYRPIIRYQPDGSQISIRAFLQSHTPFSTSG